MRAFSFRVPGLLLLLAVIPNLAGDDTPAAPAKGQRVFTAGHSFHLPMCLARTDREIRRSARARARGPADDRGSTVSQHWALSDEKDQARKAIKAGKVDVLTVSPHSLVPDPAIDKFTELLLENIRMEG